MDLSKVTIGSYRTHEDVRDVKRLNAVLDGFLALWAVALLLGAMYAVGFLHGIVSGESADRWASQVIAK